MGVEMTSLLISTMDVLLQGMPLESKIVQVIILGPALRLVIKVLGASGSTKEVLFGPVQRPVSSASGSCADTIKKLSQTSVSLSSSI